MGCYPFTLFLSASVPSDNRDARFTKIKNAQIQIEEAVIGLSRNIFSAGGKIVFGGHPSISPLITMVATEYDVNKEVENVSRNERGEKRITIFQSKVYEAVIPKDTTHLFNLGYSEIIWTDAKDGEEFNPKINNTAQCLKSMEFMRREMLKGDIDAMVCIGGMEGVEAEFALFKELHPAKPIFILKTTGGASKNLADKYSNLNIVRVLDSKNYLNIKLAKKEDRHSGKFNIIPYSFITALIVKEILDRKNN